MHHSFIHDGQIWDAKLSEKSKPADGPETLGHCEKYGKYYTDVRSTGTLKRLC